MIAGLPGTGLGGLFYLLAALVLIVREGIRWLYGVSSPARVRLWLRLTGMSLLILVSLGGTYWLIGEIFATPAPVPFTPGMGTTIVRGSNPIPTLLVATLPIQLATLAIILALTELVSWLSRRRLPLPRPPQEQSIPEDGLARVPRQIERKR